MSGLVCSDLLCSSIYIHAQTRCEYWKAGNSLGYCRQLFCSRSLLKIIKLTSINQCLWTSTHSMNMNMSLVILIVREKSVHEVLYVYCISCVHLLKQLTRPQRSSDGSLSQEEESGFGKVSELQEVVDRQAADLGQMKERMAAMVSRISELEEDLDTARKDLIKSEDMNTRQQRDLREVGRKRAM